MRKICLAIPILLLAQLAPAYAADVDVRVMLSGEVRPGVYGRVEYGNAPPPVLVYTEPKIIVRQPQSVSV